MNRRIIFIILGALLILVLIFLLWFWFLGREDRLDPGDFGSGDDRGSATSTPLGSGNNQSPFGGDSTIDYEGSVNVETPLPTPSRTDYTPGSGIDFPSYTPPGVVWFDGGALATFDPTPINQLNNVNISGTPYIVNPNAGSGGDDDDGIGLGGALGGAAAGLAACTVGLLGTTAAVGTGGAGALGVIGGAATAPSGILVDEKGLKIQVAALAPFIIGDTVLQSSDTYRENFLDCVTRGIARVAVAQITASTVDWINSGFDGKPSFIQNYEQFFTNVADEAAGAYIQGSALSFLCSPFQLKVRIAIAQSYAKRRSGEANSCTLSDVIGNVDEFMEGNFSQGGWRGFLAVTTEPTNNPFGAYMEAQAGLLDAQGRAVAEANARISPGGFLSQTRRVCDNTFGSGACYDEIVTPGVAIEESLQKVMGNSIDSLNLADSFDEIIGALVQQLMTKVLHEGLSNISGPNGYEDTFNNPLNAPAMAAAQELLIDLQGAVTAAQQYGSVQQGSISDIQNVQRQLLDLENCWISKDEDGRADSARGQINSLEARISPYNGNITRANSAIAKIEQIHTALLAADSLADVQAAESQFTGAISGGQLITQAELTQAQQNRTTLQNEMSALSQQTSSQLNQCNGF